MSQKTGAGRGPLIAVGVALAASLGVVAGTVYQQKRAAYANTAEGAQAERQNTLKPIDPAVLAKNDEAKKAKVFALREKWRGAWPTQHQDELRALLRADANDLAKLMAVEGKLALMRKEETGFTKDDITTCGVEATKDPTSVCVGWTHRRVQADPNQANDLEYQKYFEDRNRRYKANLESDFALHRDIVLLKAFSLRGDNTYYLWVSGRVTRLRVLRRQAVLGSDGKRRLTPLVHQELLPPYDFLQEEKR